METKVEEDNEVMVEIQPDVNIKVENEHEVLCDAVEENVKKEKVVDLEKHVAVTLISSNSHDIL